MTDPKLKAKELVEKCYRYMPFNDVKLTSCEESPELIIKMERLTAEQCALIAVEELIKECTSTNNLLSWLVKRKKYWQAVRTEINKL